MKQSTVDSRRSTDGTGLFKFEKLDVWRRAVDFSAEVDGLTKTFPREEAFVLSTQVKRAADSIALNIAEGSTGQSNAEFRQFLGYAVRSAIEVVACLFVGKKRGLVDESVFRKLYSEANVIVKMTQGLRNSLNK